MIIDLTIFVLSPSLATFVSLELNCVEEACEAGDRLIHFDQNVLIDTNNFLHYILLPN